MLRRRQNGKPNSSRHACRSGLECLRFRICRRLIQLRQDLRTHRPGARRLLKLAHQNVRKCRSCAVAEPEPRVEQCDAGHQDYCSNNEGRGFDRGAHRQMARLCLSISECCPVIQIRSSNARSAAANRQISAIMRERLAGKFRVSAAAPLRQWCRGAFPPHAQPGWRDRVACGEIDAADLQFTSPTAHPAASLTHVAARARM